MTDIFDEGPPPSTDVFTDDQVESINAFQQAGIMHPFTCGNDGCRARNNSPELVASRSGLRCEHCGYTQDWVHGFMADWSWKQLDPFAGFEK